MTVTSAAIESVFRERVSSEIRLEPEGIHRYRVFTPFQFGDGDHLGIVLKREADRWLLSDEGRTYMYLAYRGIGDADLQRGTRQGILSNTLSAFNVQDREGELVINAPEDSYGDALFSFIQALLKITDLTFLTRERARSTFREDLKAHILECLPAERLAFDWHDPDHDPEKMYPVDCRVNGTREPVFVYALLNDDRTRDATIALLQFEKWGLAFQSLAIFQNQETIARKVLARFTDVGEKQFSSLEPNRDRIRQYLQAMTQA